MLEGLGTAVRVRRDGRIIAGNPRSRASADFGAGSRATVGVPWGDVSTASRSTGIADIEVFFEASREIELMARLLGVARRFIIPGPILRSLQRQVDARMPPGPTAEDRADGGGAIVADAWDGSGGHATSMLTTPEPYELTARSAVEIARLAAKGEALPGYQTPSTAFGADLILGFEGVRRTEVSPPD